MDEMKVNKGENLNVVKNNKNEAVMKRLNLLFIEGNRQKIDKANVKEAYLKIR